MSVTPANGAIGSQTAEQHGAQKNIFPDAQRGDSPRANDPRDELADNKPEDLR